MSGDGLRTQVETFADGLSETVRAVLGEVGPLTATASPDGFGVTTSDPGGYTLTRGGAPFLHLRARFTCGWDGSRRYVRVDRSEIHLIHAGTTRPVIRYEYDAGTSDRLPSAHVHVHTDDPHVVGLLAAGDGQTQRARRHTKKAEKGKAQHGDVHLPLGGSRFRPVLHLAVEEFGVDAAEGWREHLADGREAYRRTQTRAVARDAPEEAAELLQSLGYTVQPPPGGPPGDRLDRLREP